MSESENRELQVTCQELRVQDCDFVAHGEAPAEIVEQLTEHLRSEHGIDLPDAEEILEGRTAADRLMEGEIDEDAALVVTRLRERLGIEVEPGPEHPNMPRTGPVAAKGPLGEGSVTR